jgi:hypothetical protein
MPASRPPAPPIAESEPQASADIALTNLQCAIGLPGSEDLEVPGCLAILERWTGAVARYTGDCLGEFQRHPEHYQHHPGLFRLLCMVTLVKKGLQVSYEPSAIGSYDFTQARHDFLHGVLLDRRGTCTSLPVLLVAIGRRLGYPLHLAVAKGHVLCQWVDEQGRLNFEGSCAGGGDAQPDEYYHRWPQPMSGHDLASGRYLRPLTPAEELALFLETRGHCLVDNRRFAEARAAYEQAQRLAPAWSQGDRHLQSLAVLECRAAGHLPATVTDPGLTPNTTQAQHELEVRYDCPTHEKRNTQLVRHIP